ncbi:hypothetical protein FRACYDRAFT_256995 [Fragilariopsis cylindrus CCMP1102]|uniref:Uncharacterized protein n=1 Tax=Fragilariopsis cylindrus CCMP1102 TaxID=635003 RepID=A0A1E7EJC8_9STRA|nr:hypothetical protein FRACYDRAFT_256995 [Fragilariopsis cylindrus CCMP1102]|eukprot:OEU06001.1 hypothetical protein FRACYDRAFT_256995 [Fragilariopsis cylindrus CCMP1102]
MDMDSTNSHNINSSSSSSMNASIISHRQGHYNHNTINNSNNNIEEVTVEEDRYWFSSSSSFASFSCLSLLLLVSRLIKRYFVVIGRAGSSSLFSLLALICGLLTLSNVQHSFRTIIETETRVMVNSMNGNGNIATVAQQGRLFNRTNNNITTAPPTPPILPKTKIFYPTILSTNSNDSSPVNAATAAATTIATTTETTRRDESPPPLPSPSSHISLHRIYTPTYMARIHAILHHHHPTTSTSTSMAICPIDTPLGKGLQPTFIVKRLLLDGSKWQRTLLIGDNTNAIKCRSILQSNLFRNIEQHLQLLLHESINY